MDADLATDEEQARVQTFYEDLGTLAQEKKSVHNFRPSCVYICLCSVCAYIHNTHTIHTLHTLHTLHTQCDGVSGVNQGD